MAFKQKMVQRLTGRNAVRATQLAQETGVAQQNLSRWLQEARSLPIVADRPGPLRTIFAGSTTPVTCSTP